IEPMRIQIIDHKEQDQNLIAKGVDDVQIKHRIKVGSSALDNDLSSAAACRTPELDDRIADIRLCEQPVRQQGLINRFFLLYFKVIDLTDRSRPGRHDR